MNSNEEMRKLFEIQKAQTRYMDKLMLQWADVCRDAWFREECTRTWEAIKD